MSLLTHHHQLALLRKKTELGKATRSLKDCLWKKEKTFLGRVDGIVQPAIAQCQQRFKVSECVVSTASCSRPSRSASSASK